ncbi:N-acyl-D-amino-acid deacylase family protein [Pseudoalteromonas 'SMAR']|uniref:N-acyl-D-amino-acid deacylase family protein n=1 Tax=Pseudoalteromonas 'SMAR' TaxID=3416908 RepID=UPI003AF23282
MNVTRIAADTIIRGATVYNYPAHSAQQLDVAIAGDKIIAVGECHNVQASEEVDGKDLVLAPGFIDVHTHDDLEVIRNPEMLSKISQGVTTVIAGNCGISAVPFAAEVRAVEPLNLLGTQSEFAFAQLQDYRRALQKVPAKVNVAMLIGHTCLRAQVMEDLSVAANEQQLKAMQTLLDTAMRQGALGLSSGLAYQNANAASSHEVTTLAKVVAQYQGVYATHLRTEFQGIIAAMEEAYSTAQNAGIPLVISHIKCAGKQNWGRAAEVINHFELRRAQQDISCDCYPYAASSSTLDLHQVSSDAEIFITWSKSHPEMAQQSLADIASQWQLPLMEAAKKLQPAGAVYHCMQEQDVEQFLAYQHSMIGSDGLPCDPHPHPRLWGTFPRVLGEYSRERELLSMALAIHKMTALPAWRFGLQQRGQIKPGYFADLVLFDAKKIKDTATYVKPQSLATGIEKVWVNGKLSYLSDNAYRNSVETANAGRFLTHNKIENKKRE